MRSSLALLLLFLDAMESSSMYNNARWILTRDSRQTVGASGVFSIRKLQALDCAAACVSATGCYGFNWHHDFVRCERVVMTQSSTPLAEPSALTGWSYYQDVDFIRNPCVWGPCNSGSVCLTYPTVYWNMTPPVNIRSYYTCSGHSWLKAKHDQGLTDCRFNQNQNMGLFSASVPQYDGVILPYTTVLDDCYTYGCLYVFCMSDGGCWMKTDNHITLGQSMEPIPDSAVFWADCYIP